ncbi:MAG: class I SAM-dependent methyltransferase [Erythrobacter sp.]|nr:class I SAM-dependent methyltransferase [Erythrobacter sp.]
MRLRGLYDAHVTPRLIAFACGREGIGDHRRLVVPLAEGHVFEIGCGGGFNQALYDPAKVVSLSGIDPNEKLLEQARASARAFGWDADMRYGRGEDIPFPDSRFDTVVCTYTLCSVEHPERVLRELRRILKPGGRLLFLEHGRAPDAEILRWQKRVEPFWKPLAGGCHLTWAAGASLRANGFEVEPLGQDYLGGVPRIFGWMEWGVARRRGA